MKKYQVFVVLFLIGVCYSTSCAKEATPVPKSKAANAVSVDDSRTIGSVVYAFSPWLTRTATTVVDKEFTDLATANAAQDAIEKFYNTRHDKSGAIYTKWTGSNQIASGTTPTTDLVDPCGIEGTCGSSSGGTTFIISFTFYSDNFSPDYTGYIIVTEDDFHDITNVEFKVEPTGVGIYGSMGTVSASTKVAPNAVTGGNDIIFDFSGIQKTAMGLGKLFAHADFKFGINGIMHLDNRNNPTGGTATMKPR